MAIRCAELGIPAMIGCGVQRFEYCKKANVILLDAQNKYVKIIS
jgi:glutamine kinase